MEGELEAAKIYKINFDDGSQVYPRVVHRGAGLVRVNSEAEPGERPETAADRQLERPRSGSYRVRF